MFGEREREREQEERQRERREDHREAVELHREANEIRRERNDQYNDHVVDRYDERVIDRPHERFDSFADSSSSPTFEPSRLTKILISPGHGAGWVTYAPHSASDAFLVWMLTYEPLIHALDRGAHKDRLEEILRDFHKEAHIRQHMEHGFPTARAGDIEVREVRVPFEIRETDGQERIEHVGLSHRRVIRL